MLEKSLNTKVDQASIPQRMSIAPEYVACLSESQRRIR